MKVFIFLILCGLNAWSAPENSAVVATGTPIVDGKIETIWEPGRQLTDFLQTEPDVLAPASTKTEVFFLYDAKHIYLAARMTQPSHTVRAIRGKRDAGVVQDGDHVIFLLDPLRNGNFAYYFVVNPANAVSDGLLDAAGTWDAKWDGVFERQTTVTDSQWTVEIKIPLSTLQFQQSGQQDWGFLVVRRYAQRQETSVSRLQDKNEPYRISGFDLLRGLEGIQKSRAISVTPYVYSSQENDHVRDRTSKTIKSGGELKYRPFSSLTLLATVHPDYAQLETDNEVINVSDLPTDYPEKRPFFTESSDLYQCLAVNTRNISDIAIGLKARQVAGPLKYDLTWVRAKDHSDWAMADLRYTDNTKYLVEFVTGARHDTGRTDYNFTTNLRTWFLDKRLTAYTWFGTINRPGGRQQYETVNSMKWITRDFNAGVWTHVKTKYYNPNIVGFNTLSNEVIFDSWARYTFYQPEALVRKWTIGYQNSTRDVQTNPGHYFHIPHLLTYATLHPSDFIGSAELELYWLPPTKKYFRYRNSDHFGESTVYRDALGTFVLVGDRRHIFMTSLKSDYSKQFGFKVEYDNQPVRASTTHNVRLESYFKWSAKGLVGYSLDHIRIARSAYQTVYRQSIHRWKAEYSLTDRFHLRAVYQHNRSETPSEDGLTQSVPLVNLTLSWEYAPGSNVYVVFNRFAESEDRTIKPRQMLVDRQVVALKINRTIIW